MVIALSGVQFGLKSKSNEHAARVRFEIRGMIADQNCTPCTQFNYHFFTSIFIFNGNVKHFIFLKFHWLIYKSLETDWRFCCSVPLSWAGEKVRFRAENSEILESIVLLKDNLIAKITSDF